MPRTKKEQDTFQVVSDAIDRGTPVTAIAVEQPNERWERITTLAKDYATLSIADKVKLWKFIEKDLEAEREARAKELASIDKLLGVQSEAPRSTARPLMTGAGPVTRRKRTKGGMTTAEAILKVLDGRNAMLILPITQAVQKLKGNVSMASINQTLGKLKREKKIKKVGRGLYEKA